MLPSGVVLHRAQFEAIVRSIWVLYAANDDQINKLADNLTVESEQGAKNMPMVAAMVDNISTKAPKQAYEVLSAFKDNSWKAMNSYVHAGIHPIQLHDNYYPIDLIINVFKNANALAAVTAMQIVVLSGRQLLQHDILNLVSRWPECTPPPV